jgi:Rrf2 family protein
MRITYKGEYAMRAILDLSFKYSSNEIVPLPDISRRQKIPLKYLEQIMLALKKGGFVDSKRGIGGGFFLKIDPKEITVGHVLRHIDGPIEPTAGMQNGDANLKMSGEEQKAFEEVWMNVTTAIAGVIDHVTFADIMCRVDELRDESANFNYMI